MLDSRHIIAFMAQLFQNTASNILCVQPQDLLGAGETVIIKASFEDWIWNLDGVMANPYYSDNGVFILDHFRSDFQGGKQTQSFSGVGAKHQNGKSERAIQTIIY